MKKNTLKILETKVEILGEYLNLVVQISTNYDYQNPIYHTFCFSSPLRFKNFTIPYKLPVTFEQFSHDVKEFTKYVTICIYIYIALIISNCFLCVLHVGDEEQTKHTRR